MKFFKQWSKRKKIVVGLLALGVVLLSAFAGYRLSGNKTSLPEVISLDLLLKEKIAPEVADQLHPITGNFYTIKEAEEWKARSPIAVMVENSLPARPQSGLVKADIVYEALAEGDITRFAAIFHTEGAAKIGPTRSAREYYLDWIKEYKAAYAHWGGNEHVRAVARSEFGQKDLDQFAIGGAAFYRVGSGEHSGFTDTAKLWNVLASRGANTFETFSSWKFKSDSPAAVSNAKEITANFDGGGAYRGGWQYDGPTNSYKRINGGAPHTDRESGQQIIVKNVIVQFIDDTGYRQVTPGVSNRTFRTIGSGRAQFFLDGTFVNGTWKKDSRNSRTTYFDEKGQEISFNRGKFWVAMLPSGRSLDIR